MVTSPLNLSGLNGTNGTTLLTSSSNSTGPIGDINGDKIEDFLITGPEFDPATGQGGKAYILFGTATYPATSTFNAATLNGANGFAIDLPRTSITSNGTSFTEQAFVSSPGDVNGDGITDLIISYSPFSAQIPGSGTTSTPATVQVVFGRKTGFTPTLDLASLNGSNGFTITGGYAYSSGDVNNDGVGDILLSNPIASPNGQTQAGQVYVIFGKRDGFTQTFDVNAINGTNGLTINGAFANARLGRSDFAVGGDYNGDGISDLGIFDGTANTNNQIPNYIIFGFDGDVAGLTTTAPNINASGVGAAVSVDLTENTLNIDYAGTPLSRTLPAGFLNVTGSAFDDELVGNDSNNVLTGGAGADSLTGGGGKDQFGFDIGKAFNRGLMGVDEISDFAVKDDKCLIDRTTFTKVKKLSFESVETQGEAKRSNALIVYNENSGGLFYNENGGKNGFGKGGQFASLADGLNLTAKNFSVVA